jgi:arylsulfatase A-like enzyme
MNFLLYVIDCLRADHVSCYGYNRQTTPNIDRLAQEGILFQQAFSPSTWTKPVAASLLTGLYPPTHGVRMRSHVMSRAISTVAEWLNRSGYATLAVSTIGNFSSALGFDKGFDRFIDLYKEPSLLAKRTLADVKKEKLYLERQGNVIFPLAEDINEAVFPWLEGRLDQDFFVMLWAMDPHDPYHPPDRWNIYGDSGYKGRMDGSRERAKSARRPEDLQHLIDLYDGEVAYADWCFGQLIDWMKDKGIYDQTAVFVLGDHGEAFGDHGQMLHGHLPFEEIIHVPLILKLPGGGQAGARISALASLVDVMPTILDMAEIPGFEEGVVTQGTSLLSLICNPNRDGREMVFSDLKTTEAHSEILAVRGRNWKYIWIKPSTKAGRMKALCRLLAEPETLKEVLGNPFFYLKRHLNPIHEYLYDLTEDPHETHNLARHMVERAGEFQQVLKTWLSECAEFVKDYEASDGQRKIDRSTLDQLRALGYL